MLYSVNCARHASLRLYNLYHNNFLEHTWIHNYKSKTLMTGKHYSHGESSPFSA